MPKKILAVSLVLGLALASMVFAAGPGGRSSSSRGANQRIVVTGVLSIDNLYRAVLRSRGRAYELIVPQNLVYRSGVREGSRITVEGYVQGRPMGTQQRSGNNAVSLVVTKATINGRTYNISQNGDQGTGRYGDDPRGDRMGGRGRGQGHGNGYGNDYGNDFGDGYGDANGDGWDNGPGRGQGDGWDNGQDSGQGQGRGRGNGRDNSPDNGQGYDLGT